MDCLSSTALRAALVPTGTKAGVSITPCGVVMRPTRAREPGLRETCSTSNLKKSGGEYGANVSAAGGSAITSGTAAAASVPHELLMRGCFTRWRTRSALDAEPSPRCAAPSPPSPSPPPPSPSLFPPPPSPPRCRFFARRSASAARSLLVTRELFRYSSPVVARYCALRSSSSESKTRARAPSSAPPSSPPYATASPSPSVCSPIPPMSTCSVAIVSLARPSTPPAPAGLRVTASLARRSSWPLAMMDSRSFAPAKAGSAASCAPSAPSPITASDRPDMRSARSSNQCWRLHCACTWP
mmetsp:Transcript_6449/g.14056  ORF Transcript_6449/g.14056 Transcript_6449/m.14056 type:complete len:298 (+) Transcript_6449:1306-2199(+)